MKLQISKWGNSLAVRLPAAFIRNMGAKADKMRKQQAEMPMSYLTVAEIRKLERY